MKKLILAAVLAVGGGYGVLGSATAGASGGPRWDVARCQARATNSYTITFRGGEYAEVRIAGDGDTDLDLFVYDEFGNLVGQGIGATDREVVGWTPRFTGPFTIRVVNLGGVWNQYRMDTN